MANTRRKLGILTAVLVVVAMLAAGCGLIEKTPEAIAKQKVAKVGGEYITRAELDEMVEIVKEQIMSNYGYDENFFTSEEGKNVLAEQKKTLVDSMVEQKIFEQKSKELNLFKDENEITSEVDKMIDTQVKGDKTDEEFKEWLDQIKMSPEMLRKLIRQEVIYEKLYENVTKDVAVSEDEIKKYYDANNAGMTEKTNTMEVSHILLNTEDEAKDIKARLDKGEDFATLAKEYSTEPAAKETGGNLGQIEYFDPGYDQTFVLSAMSLKEGEISNPVQTRFGYHIIKVTKKTEYPVLPFETVKDDIKEMLLSQSKQAKYGEALTQWKDEAKIEIFEDNFSNIK